MEHQKRKIKNFIVNPGFQLKFSFYFIVTNLFIIGVMVAIIYSELNNIRDIMSHADTLGIEAQLQINKVLFSVTRVTLFFLVLSTILSWIYAIVISHRIAGPMLAIRKTINDLKEGQYGAKRPLRPYDELRPIMDDLHELSDTLKEKHPH